MPASFKDLVELMARLRSPDGCPWDREQNYSTLAPMLLEESYEAIEAVDEALKGEPAHLRDELGDLLFQIVFYAQVAAERNDFTIDDLTDSIHTKMVRRHPHVFGGEKAQDTAEVLKNWEAIKAAEKNEKPRESLLDGVSGKVPSLMEAYQLTTKAARVGFDWKRAEDIFAKIDEELGELREAISEVKPSDEISQVRVREEMGDLLFVIVNLCRHLSVEPEAALKLSNRKFRRRFKYIEQKLESQNRSLDQSDLEELDQLWNEAKSQEK
jgi:MazG family protein